MGQIQGVAVNESDGFQTYPFAFWVPQEVDGQREVDENVLPDVEHVANRVARIGRDQHPTEREVRLGPDERDSQPHPDDGRPVFGRRMPSAARQGRGITPMAGL